jgi:FkbM family methyltransferase
VKTTYSSLKAEAERLGWAWVIGYRILKRFGIREVRFHPAGLASHVYCRIEGSDIYDYKQALGSWAEPLSLHFRPRTIIDAGANVGYASLRFAKEFPEATIIAVEPSAENLIQLRKNCARYPNIYIERAAVWPRSGSVRIVDPGVAYNAFQVEEDAQGDIPAIRVSDLIAKYYLHEIDLLKVDIEGAELALFEDPSAGEWLRLVRMMLIETHDDMLPGCSESVRNASSGFGELMGHINEYEYWVFNQEPSGRTLRTNSQEMPPFRLAP